MAPVPLYKYLFMLGVKNCLTVWLSVQRNLKSNEAEQVNATRCAVDQQVELTGDLCPDLFRIQPVLG